MIQEKDKKEVEEKVVYDSSMSDSDSCYKSER